MPEAASDYNRTKLDNFIIKLKFFSAKALFVKAYGLQSLSHIMHPKYVGTILKGSKMHDLSCSCRNLASEKDGTSVLLVAVEIPAEVGNPGRGGFGVRAAADA